jgi:predicted DNA-binding protein
MDPEAFDRLKRIKARTGQSESEQIRSAIDAWLDRADRTATRSTPEAPKRRRTS